MFKHLMNTKAIRIAGFAIAIGLVTAIVSIPAGASDDHSIKASELKNRVENAETAADHERIAKYFDAEAARYEAESKNHGELAPFYQRNPDPALSKHPGSPRSFEHCDSLTKSLHEAAEGARLLAADHRQMAKAAK
jgi:hypothetical protein